MEDRDILLRLRRQYSKDEAVKALLVEIGVLKSDIAELQDMLQAQTLLTDEGYFKLTGKEKQGYYVTAKRFAKQVKLTEYFIDLFHKEKKLNGTF